MDAPRHTVLQKYSPLEERGNMCWHMESMIGRVDASTVQERNTKKSYAF